MIKSFARDQGYSGGVEDVFLEAVPDSRASAMSEIVLRVMVSLGRKRRVYPYVIWKEEKKAQFA